MLGSDFSSCGLDWRARTPGGLLLKDVCQFMRQQTSPFVGMRGVLTGAEYEMLSDGIGHSMHDLRRLTRQVITEPRFKEAAGSQVERFTGSS